MVLKESQQKEKATNWGVSILFVLFWTIAFLIGCQSSKRYIDSKGYEVIHHRQKESNEHVPLLVHGTVTVSETGKKVPFATLDFESKTGHVYRVKADKNGNYSIALNEKYFEGAVNVEGRGCSFKVEDIFFGYSDASEFNVRLYNYDKPGNFVVLDKDAIISIRNMNTHQDSVTKNK